MTKDMEQNLILTPLPGDVLRSAIKFVCTQPDADLLLAMLGLDGVAP